MNLFAHISDAITTAMLAKDVVDCATLRNVQQDFRDTQPATNV